MSRPDRMPNLQEMLLLLGRLNYTWTNTESLLIYLIAGLAGVDKEKAAVIFLTLNTTRARIDLVERLAKLKSIPPACREEVLALTKNLLREAGLRNKFNHCIYSFDPENGRGMTQMMRIADGKEEIRYGKVESLDEAEMQRIRECIASLGRINKNVWQLVEEYNFPT